MGKHSQETKAARRHVIVDKVPVLAAMISLAFAAGVGEELCFRGLFLGTLMRQWKDDHRKVAFAAVYIRSGNLLVPMVFHVLTDIVAYGANTSVSEGGVLTGTYKLGDAADDVMCLILMIIGLWMLRSGVFDEIRKIWNRKWKSY